METGLQFTSTVISADILVWFPNEPLVLVEKGFLDSQSSHRADVLDGVHCDLASTLQRLRAVGRMPGDGLQLQQPGEHHERYNAQDDQREDPGVDEGYHQDQYQARQRLHYGAESTAGGLVDERKEERERRE